MNPGPESRSAAAVPSSAALTDSDYRLMVDAIGDYAICLLDPQGCVLSWNRGAQALEGYTAEEVLGRHFSMFCAPEQVEDQWPPRALETAARAGRFADEGWRLRKDGVRFRAHVLITRLDDAHGALRGYSMVTRDLTGRREAQDLLQRSEERFRLLVEHVQDYAIFMLGPQGHVLSWNVGAQKAKGYRADEIIGRHFSVFYPPEAIASGWPERELEIAVRDGRIEDEGWRLRKDGTRFWASVVITALYDQTGEHRGFAKVTRDLTDRRRIRALEDEGRQMTTFLAMLGHELRNPLAPISNALSIMQVVDIESQPLRLARDVIGRQLGQITRLVDGLLDLGRITGGKIRIEFHPVNLREVVAQAVEATDRQVQAGRHELEQVLPTEDLWVMGDRVRLVQVMSNLLGNAAKFTPEGGRIEIRLACAGDKAEIGVKDNGPGIPPADLRNVFNPFVQGQQDSARSQSGLGLGLSVVQQLVELHNGDVSAFSVGQPGKGCEIIVRLPLSGPPCATTAPSAPSPQSTRKQILVADDNVDAADTLGLLLESLGHSVQVAYDGAAALDAIRTRAPHLALLDIGLPHIDGLELARRIHDEVARPPLLVAVTGYGQQADRQTALAAGFRDYLVKPLRLSALAAVLARCFGADASADAPPPGPAA